ncbi:hypothetical protein GCM10028794_28280 [Silanimonas algicola]
MKSPFEGLTPEEIELARAAVLRAQAIQAERRENEAAIADARRLQDQVGNADPRVTAEIASAISAAETARESLDKATDQLALDLSAQSKASAAAAQFATLISQADKGDDDARRAIDLAMDDLRNGRSDRPANPVINAIEEVVDRAPVSVAIAASNIRVDREQPDLQESRASATDKITVVAPYPPGFDSRFIAVGTRFFTKDQAADKQPQFVFRDKGARLEVAETFRPADISALVDVAEARGWSSIKLTGTEEFRRAMWLEASLRGMDVRGFTPTPEDKARLSALQAERAPAQKQAPKEPNAIERDGERRTRAPAAVAFLDAKTPAQRVAAAERHPTLKSAFALEAAMEAFASRSMGRAAAAAFLERSRANIARDLEAGISLPSVRLREPKTQERQMAREAQER